MKSRDGKEEKLLLIKPRHNQCLVCLRDPGSMDTSQEINISILQEKIFPFPSILAIFPTAHVHIGRN